MGDPPHVRGAVDTHTHLNHPRLLRRLDDVVARARAANVTAMIVVGYDLPSSERAVELARQYEGLWATVGVHPHDATALDEGCVGRLRELAKCDTVVAIGETGLDFFRNLAPRDAQERAFRAQLALALELGLPAIVHCRHAQREVLETLDSGERPPVVWHCFDEGTDEAERAVALGLRLGFGGRLTHKGADELRNVARQVPGDRILLETDCPYLTPEPRRGRDNEPANVQLVAECLAGLRGQSKQEVEAQTAENAALFFGLGGPGE